MDRRGQQPGPRLRAQVERDREIDLALDQEVGVERQRVERHRDGSVDRVLERYQPDVDLAPLDGRDDVRHGPQRHLLGRGEIGLREQGVFGERAAGTEEADAGHEHRS